MTPPPESLKFNLQGLQSWESSVRPYTDSIVASQGSQALLPGEILQQMRACTRGLVVVGEQREQKEALACVQISETLGWPLVADVLSGNLQV